MCAFNKVNGVYACESDELLNRILKAQLDFEGWVMSDYGATHSTTQAILGGLDQEMPGNTTPQTGPGACFFCGPLLDAVRAGQVPVTRIDDAVLRILRPMFALGLFDNPPVVSALPEAEHGRSRDRSPNGRPCCSRTMRRRSRCRATSGRSPSSAPTPTRSSPEGAARWSSRPTR